MSCYHQNQSINCAMQSLIFVILRIEKILITNQHPKWTVIQCMSIKHSSNTHENHKVNTNRKYFNVRMNHGSEFGNCVFTQINVLFTYHDPPFAFVAKTIIVKKNFNSLTVHVMAEPKQELEKLKQELERLKQENNALKESNKSIYSISKKWISDNAATAVSGQVIDSILDEIDAKEEKKEAPQTQPNPNVYWVRIGNELAVYETTRIKEMILSGELTRELHGERLLCLAAWYGAGDVIDTIKMHWKGITPAMYEAGIAKAEKAGNFHCANQLYFGKMGKEAKANSMAILERIKREKAVNDFLCKQNDKSYLEETLAKVLSAIEKRQPFSQDMLSLVWEYCWHYREPRKDILESKLWKTIADQMTDIIQNMQTMQRDFLWLVSWLLHSVIFYIEIDGKPLFERANEIVNTKINIEATGRLNAIMMELKTNEKGKQWDELQAYGMEDDFVMVSDQEEEKEEVEAAPRRPDVRQDTTEHPLKPEYNEHALRRLNAVIGKSGVNMIDHYNETVYLGQLHMKNAILNDDFQHSVEQLLLDMKAEDKSFEYAYKAGPIKKLERCLTKIDTKYIDAKFPSSGQILDIARCTIILQDMPTMLKTLRILEEKIGNGEGHNIEGVLRKKNLFRDYSFKNPGYCDVKLNVEVFSKSVESIAIVAEIQVMVQFMNTFKKEISHKLYQIQRQQEHFEKMTKISKKLTEFEPNFTAILAKGKVKDLCKFMIERMLDTNLVINYRFKNKSNIFHAIFRFDNIEIYKYLTRPGQAVPVTDKLLREKFEEKDGRGSRTFYELLKSNAQQLIQLMCEKFPDLIINFKDERTHLRAIHYASYKGNPELLDFVFAHAPKDPEKLDELIMATENDGTTVMQWAANKGMLFAMKRLWNNASAKSTKKEMLFGEQRRGRTAFYYTCVGNHVEHAEWLLSLCENDEERAKMIHHKLKTGQSFYDHMVKANTFPSMIKRLKAWMKKYPLQS
eukprot:247115_1